MVYNNRAVAECEIVRVKHRLNEVLPPEIWLGAELMMNKDRWMDSELDSMVL